MNSKGLEIKNLSINYRVGDKSYPAVKDVSMVLKPGRIMGLIGESGCGKSTVMNAILDTLPKNGFIDKGEVLYDEKCLLSLKTEERRKLKWTEIACAFQYAQSAMNPVATVMEQFLDVFEDHDIKISEKEKMEKVKNVIDLCGLDWERVVSAYPHELSGGMRQRVIIANSLILDPNLLLLDEPTTALDIITQSFVVELLRNIHKKLGMTVLIISHDIGNIAKLSEDLTVMYAGRVVETGTVEDIFYEHLHPYTKGLIDSTPSLEDDLNQKFSIGGEPPNLLNMPEGCKFHPRCSLATSECKKSEPKLRKIKDGHFVACFNV